MQSSEWSEPSRKTEYQPLLPNNGKYSEPGKDRLMKKIAALVSCYVIGHCCWLLVMVEQEKLQQLRSTKTNHSQFISSSISLLCRQVSSHSLEYDSRWTHIAAVVKIWKIFISCLDHLYYANNNYSLLTFSQQQEFGEFHIHKNPFLIHVLKKEESEESKLFVPGAEYLNVILVSASVEADESWKYEKKHWKHGAASKIQS